MEAGEIRHALVYLNNGCTQLEPDSSSFSSEEAGACNGSMWMVPGFSVVNRTITALYMACGEGVSQVNNKLGRGST
jgi:hypothetical protein